jgi:hypothetical protein
MLLPVHLSQQLIDAFGSQVSFEVEQFVIARCKDAGWPLAKVQFVQDSGAPVIAFEHSKQTNGGQSLAPNNLPKIRIALSDDRSISSRAFNELLTHKIDAQMHRSTLSTATDLSQSWHELFNQTIVEYFSSP